MISAMEQLVMLHYHFSHNGMLPITKVTPWDNNDKEAEVAAAAAAATGQVHSVSTVI